MPLFPIMAVGAGICSAMAMLSIVLGTVFALPTFYFASLPLYVAGLGIGMKGVGLAVGIALAMVALMSSSSIALPFIVAYGVPALLICHKALQAAPSPTGKPVWTPPGDIVASMTAIAAVALVFVAMLTMMDGRPESLQETVAMFLGTALKAMNEDLTQEVRAAVVQSFAPFFPGMAAASWIIMHVVNAAVGQVAAVKSGINIRPRISYIDLTLPEWSSWMLVLSGIMALVLPGDWSYVGYNLVVVSMLPFFVLGLAVVHTFARQSAHGTVILVVFYVFLMVLGWSAFVVAGAGIIEQWIGLRKRVQPNNNQESE